MPSVNSGPANLVTQQFEAVMTPQSTANRQAELGVNLRRLLAVTKALSIAGTGDLIVLTPINASAYAISDIFVANAVGGSAAAANFTINAGAAVTGTQFRAAGVLAGVTGPTTFVSQTVTSNAVIVTTQTIFINNSVAVAGVVVDIYIYGYDLSPTP